MMTFAGLLVLVVCAAGCTDDMTQSSSQNGGSDDTGASGGGATSGASLEWRAIVSTTNAGYALSGDAIVRMDVDDRVFRARVTIRNDQWGSVRPWHVRAGRCSTGGPIMGDADDYPALMTDRDGTATISIEIPVALDATNDYHVAVLPSSSKSAMPIGCGNLRLD
jgi:hypothetical protein